MGVYEADDDESISTSSSETILSLTGSIRDGLDTTYNADMITTIE